MLTTKPGHCRKVTKRKFQIPNRMSVQEHYTNMPCQCGYPDGMSPRGRENHPPEGRHSIRICTLAWHICFIIPNKPQFGKISMKTTMTAGRSSENGGRFAGGHDGMANLCKPITASDFHVRYNIKCMSHDYDIQSYRCLPS